jgi:hypothetical protein
VSRRANRAGIALPLLSLLLALLGCEQAFQPVQPSGKNFSIFGYEQSP